MNAVFSSKSLKERIQKIQPPVAAAQSVAADAGLPVRLRRNAILMIHGISPIQRYAIQDQFADGLFAFLGAQGGNWARAIHWPNNGATSDITPSAIRIYDATGGAGPETSPVAHDIYEGYWSPLSKGKTSIASVLQWLVKITFLANSSTADVPGNWKKVLWDVGFLGAALLAALILALATILSATASWQAFTKIQTGNPASAAPSSIDAFVTAALGLKAYGYIELGLVVLLGYCVAQLFAICRVRLAESRRTKTLCGDEYKAKIGEPKGHFEESRISAAAWHRFNAWLFLVVTLLTLLATAAFVKREISAGVLQGWTSLWLAFWVVLAFAAAQSARFVADSVVENVLGDLQIYTTRDTNAEFFAIRNQIIDAVSRSLLGVLKCRDGAGASLYETIHVAGHSLGSSIGLDVLMRVRMLVEEGSVTADEFSAIRSFVTFGTALEKTKFFFDVARPTMSAAHDQWDADVFGRFFDAKPGGPAIYWRNIWYERDIVANEISTYKSDVQAGATDFTWQSDSPPRLICDNAKLQNKAPFWAFIHGDYIGDPLFWQIAGPIVTA
jgi:hypothetical protein